MPEKSPSITIREAAGKDLLPILHLINSRASSGKLLRRTRKEVRKSLRHFLVAEISGEVVGCGALEIYSKKLAEIRSLVVMPDFQKRGIATALIKRFVQMALKKKIYEVLVITDRDAMFSRVGFRPQLEGQHALFLRP